MSGNVTFDPSTLWNVPYNKTIYRSILIRENRTHWHSKADRDEVARKDPIANKVSSQIAAALTSELFMGIPESILPFWEDRNYMEMFNQIITASLIHGHCMVELFDEAPYWMVFSGTEITDYSYDKLLNLTGGSITVTIEKAEYTTELVIDNKKAFAVQFGYRKNKKGVGILETIWDAISYLRLTIHNMSQYDTRLGSGFPKITVDPTTVTPEDLAAIKIGLDDIDSKNGIILPLGSDMKMEGSSAKTEFPEHIDVLLKQVASGSGLPLKFIDGDAKGVVKAGDAEGKLARSRIMQIWGQFRSFTNAFMKAVWPELKHDEIVPLLLVQVDEKEDESMRDNNESNKEVEK